MTIMERVEKMRVSDDALDLMFRKARTYNAWLPKPVPDELLRQLYDTLKWGPTSANICPARFVFIRSTAAKERLRPSLAPGNVEKTMAAPVAVIDLKFYDKLPRLFPHYPAMRHTFVNNPQMIQETALRNSTLHWFMPSAAIPALAWAATCVEILLRVALVLGAFTRVAAFLSGWLLLLFALSMTFALGLKAPLNFSVFTASAAAFLLATCRKYSWSLDSLRPQPERNL